MRSRALPALRGAGQLPFLALWVSVGATLGVAILLCLFAHPMGDDFCDAAESRLLGPWQAVRTYYLDWGGRWAAALTSFALPALFDITRSYALALVLLQGFALFALWFLLGSLAGPGARGPTLRRTLVLFALFWAGMPHPGQTVYWLNGAVVYSLNASLGLLLVGLLLRLPATATGSHARSLAVLALLAAFAAGFHELLAIVLIGVLAVGTLVACVLRDGRRVAWAICTAAAALGLVIILVSPGNELRQPTLNPAGSNVADSLVATAEMILRVLDAAGHRDPVGSHAPLGWILDARLLAASVLFVTSDSVRSSRPQGSDPAPTLWRLAIPLASLAILVGAFVAGGWALGRTLPLRAFNALYLLFLLGWFLTLWVHVRGAALDPALGILRPASAVLLALGLLFSGNTKHGLRDLAKGRASEYDRAMTRRYEEARSARQGGRTEVVLASIHAWPESFFRNDIQTDPEQFQNRCMARYFGLEAVRLDADRREGEAPGTGATGG